MSLSSSWDGASIENEWFSEQVSGVKHRGPNIPGEPWDRKLSSRPERHSCIVEERSVGDAKIFENIAS